MPKSNNTGNCNTGNRNTGDCNTGDFNTGDRNTGHYNTGHCNTGNCNTGDFNTGNRNTGNFNTGDRNTGNFNTGDRNTGDFNTGDYNKCNFSTGFFNTVDDNNVRLFNKPSNKSRNDIKIPHLYVPITEWVREEDMTDLQKKEDPEFHVKGGTLIKRTYHEAWVEAWSRATDAIRQQFLELPNFDANIFLEITGIDVRKKGTCEGKIVEIDGKKYKLQEV